MDYINLNIINKEYDLTKVFINSKDFKVFDREKIDLSEVHVLLAITNQINDISNDLDKFYHLYIRSKSTRVIQRNKNIILILEKLEKIYINF